MTIDPTQRVLMQGTWQSFIDASISSTVNLPESATIDEVYNLYMEAWKNGCKGLTIFRAGCKRSPILSSKAPKELVPEPQDRVGKIRKIMTGCGPTHVTAFFNKHTGALVETFLAKGSQGGCQNYMIGLSRFISLSAKKGATVEEIVDQLKSCGTCPSYAVRRATQKDTSLGSSCPVAVGNALLEMSREMMSELGNTPKVTEQPTTTPTCPECGSTLNMIEGCVTCPSCGFSKCS